METVFERIEEQISVPTGRSILNWLTNNEKRTYKTSQSRSNVEAFARRLTLPFEVKENIEGANNFTQLKEARNQIGNIEVTTQIKPLEDSSETKKQEIITNLKEARVEAIRVNVQNVRAFALGTDPEEFGQLTREDVIRTQFIKASAVAKEYNLSQSESEERLREIGFDVTDGRIIR